jgi:hypothetical protein
MSRSSRPLRPTGENVERTGSFGYASNRVRLALVVLMLPTLLVAMDMTALLLVARALLGVAGAVATSIAGYTISGSSARPARESAAITISWEASRWACTRTNMNLVSSSLSQLAPV